MKLVEKIYRLRSCAGAIRPDPLGSPCLQHGIDQCCAPCVGLVGLDAYRRQVRRAIAALVDVDAVEQVEVVRGPASVLYGSDAIGGVVNIITRLPDADGFRGTTSYRYGAVEGQNRFTARGSARAWAFSVMAGGMTRDAGAYQAPAGSFGDITLGNEVTVNGSGIEDRSLDLRLGWDFTPRTSIFGKGESDGADDAGFGYGSPEDYAPEQPVVDITYP